MAQFYVTFGQKYAREEHPVVLDAHPDGWVTVVAADYETARSAVFEQLGQEWACLYIEETFEPSYYPRGELNRMTVGEAS